MPSRSEALPAFAILRGGVSVDSFALSLALELESRGLHLEAAPGDVLTVAPSVLLTDEDRDLIRRWKPDLLAIVRYAPPEVS